MKTHSCRIDACLPFFVFRSISQEMSDQGNSAPADDLLFPHARRKRAGGGQDSRQRQITSLPALTSLPAVGGHHWFFCKYRAGQTDILQKEDYFGGTYLFMKTLCICGMFTVLQLKIGDKNMGA
jgi:hypothetical protein